MTTPESNTADLKRTSKFLYKYTGLSRIQSCVENGVFAANIVELNDPFEYSGIEYPEDYRVACLTQSNTKMLMWAYYGNHRDCCIEFALDYDLVKSELLREVQYISEFRDHNEMDNDELVEALYTKGKEWEHEKEWRAVWYSDFQYKDGVWKRDGDNLFLNARVKAVTFGLAAIKNPEYEDALKYLLDYNANHTEQIRIQKCKVALYKYAIKIDGQFKAQKELERLKIVNKDNNVDAIDVRHEVYDFSDEDADEGNSFQNIPAISGDNYNGEFIPTDTALLLVYAAAGDGQILKIQTLGTNPEISADGKQFMADNSHRESARWQEALDNLIRWGWVKPEGNKGKVYSVTGTGYKRADWLRENMSIDTSKDPLEERKEFDD